MIWTPHYASQYNALLRDYVVIIECEHRHHVIMHYDTIRPYVAQPLTGLVEANSVVVIVAQQQCTYI